MSSKHHHSKDATAVSCSIITVSDSRTFETDTSGMTIRDLITGHGHNLSNYEIVPDDTNTIGQRVRSSCDNEDCKVVILTGGTGISSRDSTIEAVLPILEKRLDGFGELFRMLSYEEIGAAAMLSRAIGGICNNTAIFALPGSTKAVKLAMESLIIPQLGHIAGLLRRD